MAERVREFLRAQPLTDATAMAFVARFEEQAKRALALAVQQSNGEVASRAATARRSVLRRALRSTLLRHLTHVGALAATGSPELAGKFRLPAEARSRQALLAAARGLADEAAAHKEVLAKHGMTEELLAELQEAVTQYEAIAEEGTRAQRDRVGAVSEVLAVTTEIRRAVRVLDGLIRHRFRDNGEVLAAWGSAKEVIGPAQARRVAKPGDGGSQSVG